jgi:hypothetical protein
MQQPDIPSGMPGKVGIPGCPGIGTPGPAYKAYLSSYFAMKHSTLKVDIKTYISSHLNAYAEKKNIPILGIIGTPSGPNCRPGANSRTISKGGYRNRGVWRSDIIRRRRR